MQWVRASRVAFNSSSSFEWKANVSRRSALWMNSVIVQTINVAIACHRTLSAQMRTTALPKTTPPEKPRDDR